MNTLDKIEQSRPTLGHNSQQQQISITVKLFNQVYKTYGEGQMNRSLDVPFGTTVIEAIIALGIPESEVFIAFVNGRDATDTQGNINHGHELGEGDILAISGPVPYSWGYGAPVV